MLTPTSTQVKIGGSQHFAYHKLANIYSVRVSSMIGFRLYLISLHCLNWCPRCASTRLQSESNFAPNTAVASSRHYHSSDRARLANLTPLFFQPIILIYRRKSSAMLEKYKTRGDMAVQISKTPKLHSSLDAVGWSFYCW